MKSDKLSFCTFCVLAIAIGAVMPGCGGPPPPPDQPPAQVLVETPSRAPVTEYYRYTGTLEAVERVEIRARVPGYLEKIHFTPSTHVEAGTELFTIEPDPYEIQVELAKASVIEAEAMLEQAQVEDKRVGDALARDAANEREKLQTAATLKQREAETLAAKARLRDAELNLSYTRVTSPIAGRVSRTEVDVGNLVGVSDATMLTSVVRMDPIYVYMDVSERIVLEYIERGKKGDIGDEQEGPPIEIARSSDPDGEFPFSGKIDFVDNTVDPGTGTVRVRGRLDNSDGDLFPGLFVRIRAPYNQIDNAILVRESALGTDLTGKFVFVVNEQNIAQQRPVVLGDRAGDGFVVVTSGLDGDERYITSGIQKVRPGAPVTVRESSPAPAPVPSPATPAVSDAAAPEGDA